MNLSPGPDFQSFNALSAVGRILLKCLSYWLMLNYSLSGVNHIFNVDQSLAFLAGSPLAW